MTTTTTKNTKTIYNADEVCKDFFLISNRDFIYCKYDEIAFKRFYLFAKHNELKLKKYSIGEVASILYEKYETFKNSCTFPQLEKYSVDNSIFTVSQLAIIRVFATLKKVLNNLNFDNCGEYVTKVTSYYFDNSHVNFNDRVSNNSNIHYNVLNGETVQKTITTTTLENEHKIHGKNVELDDIINQWNYRDGKSESRHIANIDIDILLNTRDNGTDEDGGEVDEKYIIDVEDELLTNAQSNTIKNKIVELKSSKQFSRVLDILENNCTDSTNRIYLAQWKKRNNLQELSRDDLIYLFKNY